MSVEQSVDCFQKIIGCDKAYFEISEYVDEQNDRIWYGTSLRINVEKSLH